MSRIDINIGTLPNDGTGDPLRNVFNNLNTMLTELYISKQNYLDINSKILNDYDDLYAHESQILIKRINNTTFLFLIYVNNKVSENEWEHTAHVYLKVFELTNLTYLRTFDLFYPGLTAGLTMSPTQEINCPKAYFIGNYIRIYCPNLSTLYKREIDISSDNYSVWTPSNLSIEQMTMKDALGNDVLVDVISSNIEIHLDYILGDGYAGYHDLMPMFRNMDSAISGSNWYSPMQLSGERSHGLPSPTINVVSNDSGNTWKFGSLIGYSISDRFQVIEPSVFYYGTELHLICRTISDVIARFRSLDNGITWIKQTNMPLSTANSKPSAINYINPSGIQSNFIALNLSGEIPGDTSRNTLAIFYMYSLFSYPEICKIVTGNAVHYPALCYFSKSLYMSYTKGLKKDSIPYYDRNCIAFTRIF